MSVTTLRPNATVALGGASVVGAGGDADVATSDDSDSTYLDFSAGDTPILGFAEPVIPAGAMLKSIAVRMRLRKVAGGSPRITSQLAGPGELGAAETTITWTSPTTIAVITASLDEAPTDIEVQMSYIDDGFVNEIRVYELLVDVAYA